jgi:Domain of unknown function (DUF4169)
MSVAPVVNLNRFRKARKREEAQQRAAENRALYGRSKTQRQTAEAEDRRIRGELDGKKLD